MVDRAFVSENVSGSCFRRSPKFVLSVPTRMWPLEKVITQFRENKAEQIEA